MTIIHIGKKVPKGWEEEAGSIHLGNGFWMFKIKKIKQDVGGKK